MRDSNEAACLLHCQQQSRRKEYFRQTSTSQGLAKQVRLAEIQRRRLTSANGDMTACIGAFSRSSEAQDGNLVKGIDCTLMKQNLS